MSCLAAPSDTIGESELRVLAGRLAGGQVVRLAPLAGGGNNRLFAVETADGGRYALKSYGPVDARGDRLGREFDGLSFLAARGVEAVPAALAIDRERRLALYQWIDGSPALAEPAETDVGQALALVAALCRIGRRDGEGWRDEAAEACLSAAILLEQIDARRQRLAGLPGEPALAAFLAEELCPALADARARLHMTYAQARLDPAAAVPAAARVLSPSDFGFHNAIRRPDGRLIFIDFEYFGWDDPVKLTADLGWHPGARLTGVMAGRWRTGMLALFADDPGFAVRLAAQRPLYAIRWCLIILNEFLPDRWRRRVFASGNTAGWEAVKAAQLDKARALLARAFGAGIPLPPDASGPLP